MADVPSLPLPPVSGRDLGIDASGVVGALVDAGYLGDRIADLRFRAQYQRPEVVASLASSARQPDALEALVHLFNLGVPVQTAAVEGALGAATCRDLVSLRTMREHNGCFEPLVAIDPLDDLLIAHDLERAHDAPDAVMGAGQSSRDVYVTRAPLDGPTVLDLGTGSGVLALGAAREGAAVTAVDLNPRALRFARFNQWFNDVDALDLREQSFFDAVGERFDQVVANPPFVLSPERRLLFRDAEGDGDDMVRDLLRHGATLLRPGGFLHMTADWIQTKSEEWTDKLRDWTSSTSCDAWVLRSIVREPRLYATLWAAETEHLPPEALGPRIDEWTAYLESLGTEAIGYGVITLRRRAGDNWFIAEDINPIRPDMGRYLLTAFAARDYTQHDARGRRLLEVVLAVSPDVALTQQWRPTTPGWRLDRAHLEQLEGFMRSTVVDELALGALEHCDGNTTVAQAITATIAARGVDIDELPRVLEAIRGLIQSGFLVPVDR